MTISINRTRTALSVALIATVATQLIYFLLSGAGADINRPVIWGVEACLFLAISVLPLMLLAQTRQHSAVWAAIAVGGMLNVVQVGMGLAMFPPLKAGGEALAPVFTAVLAQAFFLYFAGKALFGAAAIVTGMALFSSSTGLWRVVGLLAGVAGLAALLINSVAMPVGLDMVTIAGAAGTAATLLLALSLGRLDRRAVGEASPA